MIDDDPDDREIFKIALEDVSPHHKLISVFDCMTALEKFAKEPGFLPDYIFLDLNMPSMTGQQCLPELKKMAHLEKIPIIIYSTSSNETDFRSTKKLGANHFLVKPSSISTLVKMLQWIMQEKTLPFLLATE